jgi:hypothetical protein
MPGVGKARLLRAIEAVARENPLHGPRLVELTVVLDRATFLAERGLSVRVTELFERRITPRNTLLLARRS